MLAIAERAWSGPKIDEKEWDMSVFRKMQQLTKDYKIQRLASGEFLNTDARMSMPRWQ